MCGSNSWAALWQEQCTGLLGLSPAVLTPQHCGGLPNGCVGSVCAGPSTPPGATRAQPGATRAQPAARAAKRPQSRGTYPFKAMDRQQSGKAGWTAIQPQTLLGPGWYYPRVIAKDIHTPVFKQSSRSAGAVSTHLRQLQGQSCPDSRAGTSMPTQTLPGQRPATAAAGAGTLSGTVRASALGRWGAALHAACSWQHCAGLP